jgi:hypothetical protein
MYLVLLAMIPVVMALAKYSPTYALTAIALSWLAANLNWIELGAEPWSDRIWFFNPFAWQLVFFTGFALVRGWIPVPPVNKRALIGAALIVLVTMPIAYWPLAQHVEFLKSLRKALEPLTDKTHAGLLRYLHFLCVAYLAYAFAGKHGANLKGWFVTICQKVGQQALATFMASVVLSLLSGVALNLLGRSFLTYAVVNLTGCAMLLAVAYVAAWFKRGDWQKSVLIAGAHASLSVAQHLPTAATARPSGHFGQPVD